MSSNAPFDEPAHELKPVVVVVDTAIPAGKTVSTPPPTALDAPKAPLIDTDLKKPGGKKDKKEKKEKTRAEILAEEEAEKARDKPNVPLRDVFKYADRTDRILMIFGGIAAFVNGAGMPAFSEVFGRMVNNLTEEGVDVEKEISKTAAIMVYVGLGVLTVSAIQVMTWMISCERQTARIRRGFFASVMRQEAAFHDEVQPGALTARLVGDVLLLRNGFSDKTAGGIMNIGQFVCGFAFGFYRSWRLTLVMCGVLPLIAAAGATMNYVLTSMTSISRKYYAKAGDISDEVLSNIRTVQMFGTEEREVKRYEAALEEATGAGIKKEFASAIGIGCTYFMAFGSYALAFWFASVLIEHNYNDIGEITATFFAVLIGSFGLGLAFPALAGLAEARGAAHKVYEIVDRKSKIDPNTRGKVLENFRGEIEFRDMTFVYPTRPDTKLFTNLNLTVEAGTTVAFSGASGCGKSSVVGLVQRFYDPVGGQVLVDGVDLREVDLKWWRDQIGVVSQEPNLFSGTILQNVRLGKPDATLAEVQEACRQAAIHDTIMGLPEQYETSVGAVGGQLSGGQKQRIAIARAIVRQPKLLILDEATSALDRKSEMEVQAALDALMRSGVKRTVLVIAHRLVTIQSADTIHYITNDPLEGSKVAESGSYRQLIEKKGQFAAMASRQSRSHTVKDDDEEESQALTQDSVMRRTGSAALSTVIQVEGKKKMTLAEQAEYEVKHAYATTFRVAKMSTDTLWAVLVGLLGSILSGAVYPVYAIVIAQMLAVLAKNEKDKITLWACMFLVIAAGALVGWTLQGFHAFTGEKLTKKLRIMAFSNMLRQDQTFYDMPGRDPGGLQGILSGDCEAVHQLWGPSLGYKIQMVCTLSAGLVIGFVYSWKLALLAMCGVPLMIMAGAIQQMLITGFGDDKDNESSVVTETLTNIRTVMSFNAQPARFRMYCVDLDKKERKGVKAGFIAGIAFGVTQFSFFGIFALCFWYGGKLIAQGELEFADVMTASTAVLMGSMGAGEAGGFLSKMAESAKASKRVFAVIDRVPTVDINQKGDTEIGEADVELKDVRFIYPARESATVLKNFNSRLPARGQYGLMGSTGCGKSTIIQLLARFYQPARGTVTVGGKDLASLDLKTWRSQMSAVFQEPNLFSGTVRENIAYSRPGATDAEIEDAARLAGIHDDVMAMEAGYRTQVGYKGRMLSGGQKQRVAIARGLLRQPKLLLLDEATSALDNATEARVQEGILEAHRRHPMTIVSVAHRLTTIRHSDRIMLLDDGVLLEAGTHDELVAMGGEYKTRWDLFQQDTH